MPTDCRSRWEPSTDRTYYFDSDRIAGMVQQDGTVSIPRSEFGGRVLDSFELRMGSFDGSVAVSDGAFVGLSVLVSCMGVFNISTEFGTDYADEFASKQKVVKGMATLRTRMPEPKVEAVGFERPADGSVREGQESTCRFGRIERLSLRSVQCVAFADRPGAFQGGRASFRQGCERRAHGFVTEKAVLSFRHDEAQLGFDRAHHDRRGADVYVR